MLRQEVQDLHASLKVSMRLIQTESVISVVDVCHVFTWLGGTMVFWRAKEGIGQSPGAPEASNSFRIFHVLHSFTPDLGYQSKLLLYLI